MFLILATSPAISAIHRPLSSTPIPEPASHSSRRHVEPTRAHAGNVSSRSAGFRPPACSSDQFFCRGVTKAGLWRPPHLFPKQTCLYADRRWAYEGLEQASETFSGMSLSSSSPPYGLRLYSSPFCSGHQGNLPKRQGSSSKRRPNQRRARLGLLS